MPCLWQVHLPGQLTEDAARWRLQYLFTDQRQAQGLKIPPQLQLPHLPLASRESARKGQLVVPFTSKEDFERILNQIKGEE